MSVRTAWETFKVEGGELLDRVTKILEEGNARSIVIKQDGRRIAEFPLTVGVVGAVFAPVLVAVGALAAVVSKCTIEVERVVEGGKGTTSSRQRKPSSKSRSRRG